MDFEYISSILVKNSPTIIIFILFLLFNIPIWGEKFGWYTKKAKDRKDKLKEERKKEFDENTKIFVDEFVPPILEKLDKKFDDIDGRFDEVDDKLNIVSDGTACLLRNNMKDIYYKFKHYKKIPEYEAETFYTLYKEYRALGGNSFIMDLYEEIKGWEIISSSEELK